MVNLANAPPTAVVTRCGSVPLRLTLHGPLLSRSRSASLPCADASPPRRRVDPSNDRFGERVVVGIAAAPVPTDGTMPASARRSVYRIDRYCVPRSL